MLQYEIVYNILISKQDTTGKERRRTNHGQFKTKEFGANTILFHNDIAKHHEQFVYFWSNNRGEKAHM